jgi:diguanylate cyclase (GGDEF)-like protein
MSDGAGDRGPRPAPRRALGRIAGALIVVWLAAMGVAGWALVASQNRSREQMAARAESRTRYAASFISIYAGDLLARDRAVAASLLGAPRITPAQLQRVASALGLSDAGLFDSHAAVSSAGDIALVEFDGAPAIRVAVSYQTSSGPHVFSGIYPIRQTVLPTVMKHVLTTSRSQTELVDLRGGRLVTGGSGPRRGKEVVFAAPVAGTEWRLIVRTPESQLYGLLNGPGRWLAWIALAGPAVAGLAIILLIARLARRRTQLTVLNAELARLAAVDPLTGLRNRRAIEEYLHDALSAARRHDLALSVLVIDVDHFKSFNDMLGHRSGDAVLVHTAGVLDGALRAEDAIGRWGGEEFLVVLPGTDESGAYHATERLRAALAAEQPEEARAHGLPVTVTIGLAHWRDEAMDELVFRADRALYLGKAAGRDTVEVAPDPRPLLEAGECA